MGTYVADEKVNQVWHVYEQDTHLHARIEGLEDEIADADHAVFEVVNVNDA